MKKTGIIRKSDHLGRIVIPIEIRKTLGIKEGDPMEIFVQDDGVVFKKYIPSYDIKAKIENAISSLTDLSEYKGIECENTQKIKDNLELALLEFEKLELN